MGQPRFTLLIGDQGVCLTGPRTEILWALNGDHAANQAVRQRLAAQPHAPVTLLVDSGAQDYRVETLPRLSALDRRQLVRRRLRQAFPAKALVASQSRRDGQVLLAGVNEGGGLSVWRDVLRDRKTDIALLPIEGGAVLQKLRPAARAGWWLLLAPLATGGLRQIVSRDGQLVFTRLTPLPTGDVTSDRMAGAVAGDIRASLGYLARLGLTDSRQLDALLLVPDAWSAACAGLDLPLRSLTGLAPEQAARQLGLPPALITPEGGTDGMFAAAQGKPSLRLASADSSSALTGLSVEDWSGRLALGAFILALLFVLWPAEQLARMVWRNQQAATQLAVLRHDLADQQAAAAPVTKPLGRLRIALERQKLFAGEALPWSVLTGLATALGTDAKLVRLELNAGSGTASEEWQLAAQWRPVQPVTSGETAMAATPEAAVSRFRQLARDIGQALPDYAVDLTHLPYPALPQEVVSNAHDAPAATDDTALLTLRRAP